MAISVSRPGQPSDHASCFVVHARFCTSGSCDSSTYGPCDSGHPGRVYSMRHWFVITQATFHAQDGVGFWSCWMMVLSDNVPSPYLGPLCRSHDLTKSSGTSHTSIVCVEAEKPRETLPLPSLSFHPLHVFFFLFASLGQTFALRGKSVSQWGERSL